MSWDKATNSPLPDRYVDMGSVGQGSMGDVRRVRDRVLECEVALKLLSSELSGKASARGRFKAEAHITARLQHPAIVDVHDFGRLEDGRPWFTMQYVEGRTLRSLVNEVHRVSVGTWRTTPSGWNLRRLVDALARVSSAVGFAHEHGIIHRDIKPTNIMAGKHGEVLLMDWGIAKGLGLDLASEGISEENPQRVHRTIDGLAIGTPPFMPPEQALGQRDLIGPRSDVYGLGAVLYKILSGRAPYGSRGTSVVEQVRAGPPAPLTERGDLPMPTVLVQICERAMCRSQQGRYSDGHEVAEALRSWLDVQRSRDNALEKLRNAENLLPEMGRHRARLYRATLALERVKAGVKSWQPAEDKLDLWAREDSVRDLQTAVAKAEATYVASLRTAWAEDPDLPEAIEPLAEWYRRRAAHAEEQGNLRLRDLREAQVANLDEARHKDWLEAWGKVSVRSVPPGAEVRAYRFEESGWILAPGSAEDLGVTPVMDRPLRRGSYLLTLSAPGFHTVNYPGVVSRGRHAFSELPGEDGVHACRLPKLGTLAADDRFVPAGWFQFGGGAGVEPFPVGRIWVDAFVVKQFPVTVAEYQAFLCAVDAAELVDGAVPDDVFLDVEGTLAPGVRGEEPMRLITWRAAMAYAAWRAELEGLPWRLLHELEWEKAARGVDARAYPWGDKQDPCLSCVAGSCRTPGYVPVTDFPTDVSVYGVRGMAGNVSQICLNVWERDPPPGPRLTVKAPGDVPLNTFMAERGCHIRSTAPSMQCATRLARINGTRPSVGAGLRLARTI